MASSFPFSNLWQQIFGKGCLPDTDFDTFYWSLSLLVNQFNHYLRMPWNKNEYRNESSSIFILFGAEEDHLLGWSWRGPFVCWSLRGLFMV